MSDDLVDRLSTEAKIWPRSDISGLLRESTTEIERLRAEVEGLRARIEEATVGRVGIQGWMHVKRQELHGKRVALVPLND